MADFGINWNLLANAPNAGNAFLAGLESGQARKREAETRNALSAYLQNPDDPIAFQELADRDPSAAIKAEQAARQRKDYQREDEYRSALSAYATNTGGPARNALMPAAAPGAVLPPTMGAQPRPALAPPASMQPGQAPPAMPGGQLPPAQGQAPGQSGMPEDLLGEHAGAYAALNDPWQRMMEADPERATKFRRQQYDEAKGRIDIAQQGYEFAIQRLGTVRDDAGYQQTLAAVQQQFDPLGIDIRSMAPPSYPGPEGMRQLLNTALDAKDQVAALDRKMKLDWEIQDDEIDNDRADRNTNSVIEDRGARRGLVARGQNLTDARGRRGQDISSADRRRNQDITSRDRQRGQDKPRPGRRPAAAAAGSPPPKGERRRNPTTGDVVVWNGSKWVPGQ